MRNILVGLVVLSAAATAANADPIGYVESGAMAGTNGDLFMTLAVTLDGGYHVVRTPFWVHARVASGTGNELFAVGTGSLLQLRAGVESRTCTSGGALCGMVGIDVGYQRTQWTGHEDPPFIVGSDTNELPRPGDMTSVVERAIVVPRIGLDLGGPVVRVRPSLELDMGAQGVDGANATLALAFQW